MSAVVRMLNVQPDCSNFDQLPPISMNFGGMSVVIQPHGYVMKVPRPAGPLGNEAETEDDPNESQADLEEDGLTQKRATTLHAAARRWKAELQLFGKNYGA